MVVNYVHRTILLLDPWHFFYGFTIYNLWLRNSSILPLQSYAISKLAIGIFHFIFLKLRKINSNFELQILVVVTLVGCDFALNKEGNETDDTALVLTIS